MKFKSKDGKVFEERYKDGKLFDFKHKNDEPILEIILKKYLKAKL